MFEIKRHGAVMYKKAPELKRHCFQRTRSTVHTPFNQSNKRFFYEFMFPQHF